MILKPVKIKSDVSPKQLRPDEAVFILNQARNLDGLGKLNDWFSNTKSADIQTPAGETYCVGGYWHEKTMELYTWHWNEFNNDFILRYRNGRHELIYQGDLGLEIDPRYQITKFRAFVIYDQNKEMGRFLVWTNGIGDLHYLDVELSRLTTGFNHPYFNNCFQDKKYFHLLDAYNPLECITAKLDYSSYDAARKNFIIDKPWQFRYKFIYYDGRESEWSPISTTYFTDTQKCFTGNAPRCWDLRISVGNPFVEKYVIAFRNDNSSNWFEYDVVNRFGPTLPGQYWYERQQIIDFDPNNICFWIYRFCGDKRCDPLPPNELTRLENPKPINTQAIALVDNRLACFNYEKGVDPLPYQEKQKISFGLVSDGVDCTTEYVEVKVAAVVHMPFHDRNQPLYRLDGSENGTVFFGGLNPGMDGGFETGYNQNFEGETKNFIAYVDGTGFYSEMVQHQSRIVFRTGSVWNPTAFSRNIEEIGVLQNMGDKSAQRDARRKTRNGGFYIQIATIKVPKGTRGHIRIAGHKATGNQQDTSTQVAGVWRNQSNYKGDVRITTQNTNIEAREIFFDTCNGNVDLVSTPFIIFDCAIDESGSVTAKSSLIYGYIRDENGAPLELLRVEASDNYANSVYTDHNGFYFVALKSARGTITIRSESDCSNFSTIATVDSSIGEKGAATEHNIDIDDDLSLRRHFVTLTIRDCTGVPIPGVSVSLHGSRGSVSNNNGEVVLTARNNFARNRVSRVVVMQAGECILRDCNGGCNPCMPFFPVSFPNCFNSASTDLGEFTFSAIENQNRYLKPGGRYEFALVMHGNGRSSFAQTNDWLINIPTYQSLGRIEFQRVRATIAGAINWPSWVTHVSFARTRNLNYEQYLEWVVDEIEFINTNGQITNQESATLVRLTIQSLNEFNTKYFLRTNTMYQFAPGDRVEFITKSRGKLFDKVVNLQIASPFNEKKDESTDTKFYNQILVNFSKDLIGVEPGAIISLQKPFNCENRNIYQEICSPIPLAEFVGVLNIGTFDTYRVSRFMNGALQQVDHHSITDFWGTVDDAGRLYVSNTFERQTHLPRNLILSGAWSIFGARNSVNFFEGSQVKTFQGWEQGDIIAVEINDASMLFVICESDYFVSKVGDDFVRTAPDGTIRTNPSDQIVSNPQPKLGLKMGCSYNDIGSVYFGNGFVSWWDSKQGLWAFSNYQEGVDVANDQIQRDFKAICEHINVHNITAAPIDKVRVVSGWDPITEGVIFTVKKIRQPEVWNRYEKPLPSDNQTFVFDPGSRDFPTMLGFTPDAIFGIENNKFLTYVKSQPWLHRRNSVVNRFYDIAVDRVVICCANSAPDKKKRFHAIEIQSNRRWLSPKIVNDTDGFESEIPAKRFRSTGEKWNAEFLRNKNSAGGLFSGKINEGFYTIITLVKDNTKDLEYNTVDDNKRILNCESDFIFVKATEIEVSGLQQKQQ